MPLRRYIEECDYVAQALPIAGEVESVNGPNSQSHTKRLWP